MTKGLDLNNPGNIRWNAQAKYQGVDPTQPSDGEFFRFTTPVWGLRAMAVLLIYYQDHHNIYTIEGIVSRWAPESENDTKAYIKAVCERTGLKKDDHLNLHQHDDLKKVMIAMIYQEQGKQPFTDAQLDKALVLAGAPPLQNSLYKIKSIQASQVAAPSVIISGLISGLKTTQDQLQPLIQYAEFIKWGFVAIALISIAVTVYEGWDDNRRGIK